MAYNFVAASNQYLEFTLGSQITALTPMTMAVWFKRNGIASSAVAIGEKTNNHRNGIITDLNGAARAVVIGPLATAFVNPPIPTADNTWIHVCGVFACSTSRTAYLNGANPETNTANIGTQNAPTYVMVGARYNVSVGSYWNGDLAEVGIWNAELTADEIASLAKGMPCSLIRPQNLALYMPLIRNLQEIMENPTITNNNGAAVTSHPRIYR